MALHLRHPSLYTKLKDARAICVYHIPKTAISSRETRTNLYACISSLLPKPHRWGQRFYLLEEEGTKPIALKHRSPEKNAPPFQDGAFLTSNLVYLSNIIFLTSTYSPA